MKIYRESNIEHDYYRHLAKAETKPDQKNISFWLKLGGLNGIREILKHADLMLVVSITDTNYLRKVFPKKKIEYMPSFHVNDEISVKSGSSDFVLYHGKLSVTENTLAALYLIKNVFCKLKYPCIIAGMNPPATLFAAAAPYPNIKIEANPSNERMDYLTHEAQIQYVDHFSGYRTKTQITKQSFFGGRHTIVNQEMITGSGLEAFMLYR